MTAHTAPNPATDQPQIQTCRTALSSCRTINRDRLCIALARLDITSAVLCFEAGDGRSPITTYEIIRDGRAAPIPPTTVSLLAVASHAEPGITTTLPLVRALDTFAFDALYEFHPDWQQGRGAFGTVTISPVARSARLEIKFRANYAVWTATDL